MQELNTASVQEELMLSRLLAAAKEFYEKPENMRAFKAWQKSKEDSKNGATYTDPSFVNI